VPIRESPMKPQSDRLRERGGGVHGGRCQVCAPASGRRVDAGRRMASLSTACDAALLMLARPIPSAGDLYAPATICGGQRPGRTVRINGGSSATRARLRHRYPV
jgi:hypothetical protein